MNDVTPRGYRTRFNLSEFLRTDDLTRVQVASQALTAKVMDGVEARRYFDPSLPVQTTTEQAPTEQVTTEETADV